MTDEPVFEHRSGAKSSGVRPRYDLIPREGLRRLAARYTLGAVKYGEHAWKKGLADAEFLKDRTNHIIDHLWDYLEHGNATDDNLGAVVWGCFLLMEAERANGKGSRCRNSTGADGPWAVPEGRNAELRAPERGDRGSGAGRGGDHTFAEAQRAAAHASAKLAGRTGAVRGGNKHVGSTNRRGKGKK